MEDTIAAIATPPGEGGIAILRISGKQAFPVADSIFSGDIFSYKTHTVHVGYIGDAQGKKIDDALVIVMKSPRSYTGEDVVEFQCHGGTIASTKILQIILQRGARLATPGEFTYRAYLNGKIDLAQAEAVQELISAKSEQAFQVASSQLEGALSKKINGLKEEILFLTALFEAWVDFPEEGLEFLSFEEAGLRLERIISQIENLIVSFHDGEKLKYGLEVAIIGAPNVGKSSLMNALMGKEKAIVTEIAGTTRDLIEGDFSLNGLSLRLIDTAGIRHTEERIEKEGIKKSQALLEKADLVLLVLDASQGVREEENLFLGKLLPQKTIAIWNKSDLITQDPPHLKEFTQTVVLSAKKGEGLSQLKKQIQEFSQINKLLDKGEVILTSYRHKEALIQAKNALLRCHEGMQKEAFQEVLAFELKQALFDLGSILGNNVSEDILSSIFSHFCIGK